MKTSAPPGSSAAAENLTSIDNTKNKFNINLSNESFQYLNLNDKNIVYRAEGNANLVLSLPEKHQVIRLRKSNKLNDADPDNEFSKKGSSSTPSNLSTSSLSLEKSMNELKLYIEYTKFVTKLIGEKFTCKPQFINFDVNNLKNFNDWLLIFRPAERLNKEIHCRNGTLYPDVAFLPLKLTSIKSSSTAFNLENQVHNSDHQTNSPKTNHPPKNTYCVEIKPKQGWTFYDDKSNFNNKINKNILKCRFCCMQYLKMEKGTIQEISKYCPIDLFSGISQRMYKTILGLIKTPQNNLRIFKNGNLIYGDKMNRKKFRNCLNEIFLEFKKSFSTNENFYVNKNDVDDYDELDFDGDDDDTVNDAGCHEESRDDNRDLNFDDDEKNFKLKLFIKLLIKILLNDFQQQQQNKISESINITSEGKNHINNKRNDDKKNKNCCHSSSNDDNNTENDDNTDNNDDAINKIQWSTIKNCPENYDKCEIIDYNKLPDGTALKKILRIQLLAKSSLNEIDSFDETKSLEDYINGLLVKSNKLKSKLITNEFIENLDKMEKYLIGATALDCSMMLTFQRIENLCELNENCDTKEIKNHLIKIGNLNFIANTTVMDLDPKSTAHFTKYLKQTESSHLAYQKITRNVQK